MCVYAIGIAFQDFERIVQFALSYTRSRHDDDVSIKNSLFSFSSSYSSSA